MAEPNVFEACCQELDAAVRRSDWDALARADQAVLMALRAHAARSRVSTEPERAALQRLHEAHRRARAACAEAAVDLQQRMQRVRTEQEAYGAYAAVSAPEVLA